MSPEQKRIVLRLNGKESKKPDLWLSGLGRNAGLFGMVSESKAFDLAPTAQRGVIDAPIDTEIPDDALVEVEFDNGARFWTTGMDLRDRLTPPAQRTSRALVDDGTPWTLPASLDIPGERRGPIGKKWTIQSQRGLPLPACRKCSNPWQNNLEGARPCTR